MPEYAALLHYRDDGGEDGDAQPPSEDEVNDMFLRMERSGLARIN